MRRVGIGVLAVVCLAIAPAAWAQGSPVRPAGPPPIGLHPAPVRPGGVLIGQVVDAATGRGVAHAVVRLAGPGVAAARMTDDRGRFYFTNLADADLSLTASKAGFFDAAFGKRRAGGDGIPLTMSNGRWISDIRLELFKAAAIGGIVVDEGNDPLIGVRVRAWRREFAEGRAQLIPAGEVTTNDEGMYRFFDLRPAEYVIAVPAVQVTLPLSLLERNTTGEPVPELTALLSLSPLTSAADALVDADGKSVLIAGRNATAPLPNPATGERLGYQTEFYPGFDRPADAFTVTVGPGEDRVGVHFQLRLVPTHRVSGIVVGPNGPLPRQIVRLVIDGDDDQGFGNEAATTLSDADGRFTLLNVPPGDYIAQVRALAAILTAGTPEIGVMDDAGPPAASQARVWGDAHVSIADGDVHDLIITAAPAVALTGRLVLESRTERRAVALRGMTVSLLPESRAIGGSLTVTIDPSGVFAFSNLPTGSYFLRVGTPPPGWALKAIQHDGRDVLDQPIDLAAGADVTVTLTDRATQVSGTVHDARGIVVSGATVLVLPPATAGAAGLNANRLRAVRASTSGVFAIDGLPPGEYLLAVMDDAAAEGWQAPSRIDAIRAHATRVTLEEGEKKTVDLRVK